MLCGSFRVPSADTVSIRPICGRNSRRNRQYSGKDLNLFNSKYFFLKTACFLIQNESASLLLTKSSGKHLHFFSPRCCWFCSPGARMASSLAAARGRFRIMIKLIIMRMKSTRRKIKYLWNESFYPLALESKTFIFLWIIFKRKLKVCDWRANLSTLIDV